jgi:hypothetical protein
MVSRAADGVEWLQNGWVSLDMPRAIDHGAERRHHWSGRRSGGTATAMTFGRKATTLSRTRTGTLGIVAGLLVLSAGSMGATAVKALADSTASLASAASVCAHRPTMTTLKKAAAKKAKAGTDAASASAIAAAARGSAAAGGASPSASATASATPSASASSSPSASASTTPSASPSAPSPSESTSASPSPSPSPSTSPSPSPSPSPSSSPTPVTPQLCTQVQSFSGNSVHPGQTATFVIFVWSTGAESGEATVTVSIGSVAHVAAPKFTVCPQASGDACAVGDLLTGQSDELVAGSSVGAAATSGEKITLTATVKASKANSFDAKATIKVDTSGSTPSPTTSPASDVGDGLPGVSLSTQPGGYTSPSSSNPSGLFPTVSPSKARKDKDADAVTLSSTLPLDSRIIGGQLLGLVVLAGAFAVAVVRLSLRTGGPQDRGGPA